MAYFVGPGRQDVLRWLRSRRWRRHFPIYLGMGAPQAVLVWEEDVFRMYRVHANDASCVVSDPSWDVRRQHLLFEVPSRQALIDKLSATLVWPYGHEDRRAVYHQQRQQLNAEMRATKAALQRERRRSEHDEKATTLYGRAHGGELPSVEEIIKVIETLPDNQDEMGQATALALLMFLDPEEHGAQLDALLRKTLKYSEINLDLACMGALLAGRQGDAQQVTAWIAKMVRVGQTTPPYPLMWFGIRLFRRGDYDRAALYFDVTTRFPEQPLQGDPWLLHALTYLWNERSEFERSARWVRSFVAGRHEIPVATVVNAVNALVGIGAYAEAIEVGLDGLRRKAPPAVHHALACAYALSGQVEQALGQMEEAQRRGYDRLASIGSDPQLQALRELPRFQTLVGGE